MRTRAVVVFVLICTCLAGCDKVSRPPEASSGTPRTVEHSFDEQAESLWNAYFSEYTQKLADPAQPISDLRSYLTKDEYAFIEKRIQSVRDSGVRVKGAIRARNFVVSEERTRTALVCLDNGKSRLVDVDGRDVTPKNRRAVNTIRLTFVRQSGRLLIDRDEIWEKSSVC